MLSVAGYCVIATTLGAQCIQSLSNGVVSGEVGIILIQIPAMCIAFLGYKVLHHYQRWAW